MFVRCIHIDFLSGMNPVLPCRRRQRWKQQNWSVTLNSRLPRDALEQIGYLLDRSFLGRFGFQSNGNLAKCNGIARMEILAAEIEWQAAHCRK
jgi:hypothetical protein